MQIQIPTTEIQGIFTTALTNALSAEKTLGAAELAEIEALVRALQPEMVALTQEAVSNPSQAAGYAAILKGTVTAKLAALGLAAIAVQKNQVAMGISTGIQILAMVIKAAVAV